MNELIMVLKKQVYEQEQEYKKKKQDFEDADKAYKIALDEEMMRKRLILAKNFLKVVDIIHENDLRCVYMDGVDPQNDVELRINPLFVAQDNDQRDAYIDVQDGVVRGESRNGFNCQVLNKLVSDIEKFCEVMEKISQSE